MSGTNENGASRGDSVKAQSGHMSESDLSGLTASRVNRYLREKDMERPCEACGHGTWELEGIDAETQRLHVVASRLVFGTDEYFIYLPMTCENCGNTRFINVSYVLRGVRAMEAADGKE